ncbi:MAG: CotH kinase family protein [Sedimentisphaerales bacterium]|nr:CotH kinase family protein [Sedimentisphaerales bacterium]
MKTYSDTLKGCLLLAAFYCLAVLPQAISPAQEVIITEFMAANHRGIQDQDGDFTDWIEIYNMGRDPVSIGGWYLSNDVQDLTQWEFPDVVISGQSFLRVFASGKNRTTPGDELHTSFKLDRDGEYLALVGPDGTTIATEFFPEYPRQIGDVSYGALMEVETTLLVSSAGAARLWLPADDRLGPDWVAPGFDDADWTPAALGIGYDRTPAPELPREDVTRPGDAIEPTSFNSPVNEEVDKAIDNNPQTKYLNFDKLNAGFTVTCSTGPSVVTGLRLTSANDAPERDPTSFTLFGSNDGVSFMQIARGNVPAFPARFFTVEVAFANDRAYSHYRLLFPTVQNANAAVAMQIAEVEFLGSSGPATVFADWIGTDVETDMYGRGTSVYLRIPFAVETAQPLDWLALHVRYDDGLVAFLNGVEVARSHAPDTLAYDSVATADRPHDLAMVSERFGLSDYAYLIQPGANVLAIQALNDAADSPDFLIEAQLENTQVIVGDNGYFESPTPGSVNGPVSLGLVDDPVVDRERGFFEAPFEVAMACPTAGATLFYTLDGSAPTAATGNEYVGPILIDRTTTLRVGGFLEGWRPSSVVTHTYLFLDDIITQDRNATLAAGFPASWNGQSADYGLDPRVIGRAGQDSFGGKYAATIREDLQSLPSMSIVMDIDDMFGAQGIYSNPTNRGDSWERPASLELIYPDDREGFQEDAGIRIQGGAFRRFDLTLKKSFRMIFREEYGAPKLHYPLFGPDAADEFDNFILRANSNDAWPYGGGGAVYVRDTFAMDTVRDMGNVASHSTFVHLYINGFYWGLYNPVERPDAAFSASYRGGDKESWDAINQDSVPDGNYDAWNRLLAMLNEDVSDDGVYQRIQGNNPDGTRNPQYEDLLDVENMIDYMILNFYVGNTDWPHRNWWVGRNRDNGDGFQFYPWDTETALSGLNTDRTGVNNAVARPYAALRANARFRTLFGDRVHRHFFNGGVLYVNPDNPDWDPAHPENNRPAARFAALADLVERAIVGESARWGDQLRGAPYTRDEHWAGQRDSLLANYYPRRSAIVLEQFRNAGLYPHVDAPVFSHPGGHVDPGFVLSMAATSGTIYYTLDGTDPIVPVQVEELSRTSLITSDSPKKVMVPSAANGGNLLGAAWHTNEGFDDSSWISGTGGVGYDTSTEYDSLIDIDVDGLMRGAATSVFVRIPFYLTEEARKRLNFMTLRMRYDDGFVAYLNGVLIASENAPAGVQWNSAATAGHDDSAAVQFSSLDVSKFADALQAGRNLLAIHGLNVSLGSSDFLIDAELVAGERQVITEVPLAPTYVEPLPLWETTTVRARAFDGFEWSALSEASFSIGPPALAITELHYHPSDPTAAEQAAGFDDEDDFEFVEMVNPGTAPLDLTGIRFVDGIEFDFTGSSETLLAPGQYVLVVKNRGAFETRYGFGLPIAGEYAGRLSNAGEHVTLVDVSGEVLLEFTYGTEAPWPALADGGGPSLEIVDVTADPALPQSWQPSDLDGGSPASGPL